MKRKNGSRTWHQMQFGTRAAVEVTNELPVIGGVNASEFYATGNADLFGTLLDPKFQGQDVFIHLGKASDDGKGFPSYKGGPKVDWIVIPWRMRHGLRRSPGTNSLQLTPVLTVANELVAAVRKNDRNTIPTILRRWCSAFAEETRRKADDTAIRVRHNHSGSLISAVDVNQHAFDAANFSDGKISTLGVGEIGFPDRVLGKLTNNSADSRSRAINNAVTELRSIESQLADNHPTRNGKVMSWELQPSQRARLEKKALALRARINGLEVVIREGRYFIAGRWPSTDAIPAKVCRMTEKRKQNSFVLYVPVELIAALGDVDLAISFMKLVEGDNDGDGLFFNFIKNPAAYEQIADRFSAIYGQAFKIEHTQRVLSYKQHADVPVDERAMLADKIEQKTWIGPLSTMMYCGYAYYEFLISKGEATPTSFFEWMEAATQSLEKCFDKKHLSMFKASLLYGMLSGKKGYTWDKVGAQLKEQGLDCDTYGKMVDSLGGASIREKAMDNIPFRVGHLLRGAEQGEREKVIFDMLRELPADTTLAAYLNANLVPSLYSSKGVSV